jgi:hemolysin III
MKPLLRGHFHQAMFFIALGALIPLILACDETNVRIAVMIYAVGALVMFGVSSLYHRITWTPTQRQFWRKLDHAGIFLMIAGTYTPVALLGLSPESAKMSLWMVWIAAVIGMIQSIVWVHLPKYLTALIYLVVGYLAVPYFSELKTYLGSVNMVLIVAGGLAYTLGALCYAFKRPKLFPEVIGYHEVFHLFVNAGAIFHFAVIYRLVQQSGV